MTDTPGMRAAKALEADGLFDCPHCHACRTCNAEAVASIIDRETGAAELRGALHELLRAAERCYSIACNTTHAVQDSTTAPTGAESE